MTGVTVEKREGEISLSRLMDFYHREKFWGFCRACPRYGALWSCPPYEEGALPDLEQFSKIWLFCHVLHFSPELRREAASPEKAGAFMESCAAQYGKAAHEEMLRLEQSHPGSLGLTHGGCRLCAHCARPEGKTCRLPEKMRFSLESLGFSVVDLAREVLHLPISFSQEGLPAYQVMLWGLFLP